MSTKPSASGRLAGPARFIRDLPIWTKLGLIMIIPTIATIVVGTAGLVDQVNRASDAERARTLTVFSGDAGALVQTLQAERAQALLVLTVGQPAAAAYTASQDATQAAAARYMSTRTTVTNIPSDFRAFLDEINDSLGQLTSLRQQVLALNQVGLTVTIDQYDVLIDDLLQIRDYAAQLSGSTSLADKIRAAGAVAREKEYMAQEAVIILRALTTGEFSTNEREQYAQTRRNVQQADTDFRGVATPDQADTFERTVNGTILFVALEMEGGLDSLQPGQGPDSVQGITVDSWQQAMTGRGALVYQVEQGLNQDALSAAEAIGSQVQRRVLIETGVLLLTLLIGIMFAWLVARSMARSLRELRQGALAVAKHGLPQAVERLRDPSLPANLSPAGVALHIAEPLPVRSNDEFGQVTEAFNQVHLEAVRTAAEQAQLRASVATMFVNLARRSQILVDRLIGHLDRLERGEQDPDRLSELFQLDHLATRMRRNDENLLVLAGADSTRIQREPAALMDVLRAAQSEVEQYTRVEFVIIDQDIEIASHAVNDLVHLVAELFDNATSFSPPDTPIRVEARRIGERAVLRVEDRGIGMTMDQYADLNERLATPPQVDVAVSRMMGLVVVARLAGRHGVTVELQPAAQRGTIADVVLPAGVLVPRALAGHAHAPTGFPAVRPSEPDQLGAGQRSPFGPPLALESGASTSPYDAPPSYGTTPAPAYGGVPAPSLATPAASPYEQPSYERPSYEQPSYETQQPGYPTTPATPAPAFGASGLGAALTSAGAIPPIGVNGRVPAWYDLTGATGPTHGPATTPGGAEPLPQRRPGGWDEPQAQAGQSGGWPEPVGGYGGGDPYPAYSPPAASASPVPPVAASPAAWPPPSGSAPGANDMTQELPIFSELESAWFSTSPSPEAPRPGAWPPEAPASVGVGSGWSSGEAASRTGGDVSWRSVADTGWQAAEAASHPTDGGTTDHGLPRRVPMAQLVPGGVETGGAAASDRRNPDSVRGLLSAYHRGVQRGRDAHGNAETGPGSASSLAEQWTPSSGKEQEA